MAATRTIKIDLWNKLRERITVVQREILGRTLTFQLYSGAAPINLTASAVTFYAVKPDATTVFNSCTIVTATSGICSYTITEQTIVLAGDLRCWLVIVDGSGNELRTQEFAVEVQSSPDFTTSVESTSEFTALQALSGQITTNTTAIGTLASLTTTAKTNLVAAINELDEQAVQNSTFAVADDAATSFTPKYKFGICIVFANLGGSIDINAIVSYRCAATNAYCTAITAAANVATTTGVLNGKTGTDGKFTISAHTDGKIYLENRRAATKSGVILFMGV